MDTFVNIVITRFAFLLTNKITQTYQIYLTMIKSIVYMENTKIILLIMHPNH